MNTTTEMKRKLRKEYPKGKFSVRKKTYSGGKSYDIRTDLFREFNEVRWTQLNRKMMDEGISGKDYDEWKQLKETDEHNKELRKHIKELLREYENIDRNGRGEIMTGGNTYLDISPF